MIDKQGFKFYPEAWLDDKKLATCSLSAKGMWVDLLCHMHHGDPYGHLVFNNKVLNKKEIQNLLRITNQEVFDTAWQELREKGIIQKEQSSGSYYSKRMTYEHSQQKRSEAEIKNSPIYPFAQEIITHLNTVAKRNYPVNLKNFELIERWMKEGKTVKDFKIVNELKTAEWQDSAKMSPWIRPSTLYGENFLNYLSQNPNHKLASAASGKKWRFDDYYTTQQKQQENGSANK
jgi:uncharacterized phage protein (TIGR02220 family)